MSAFLYGVGLQWKLDIRSKSLLITCYVVPLLFFAVMGGIFTSVNPAAKDTLIQSMTVMGVSMGALIGLPPSLVEIYASDIKKAYKANGVPLYLGLVSMYLSAFIHLMIMSGIIYVTAPLVFDAALPVHPLFYFGMLAVFIPADLPAVYHAVGDYVPGRSASRAFQKSGKYGTGHLGVPADVGYKLYFWKPVAFGSDPGGSGSFVRYFVKQTKVGVGICHYQS